MTELSGDPNWQYSFNMTISNPNASTSSLNQSLDVKDCLSLCLSEKIELDRLTNDLGDRYSILRYKDVCHIDMAEEKEAHLFIFRYGVVIFWGGNDSIRTKYLAQIRPYFVDEYEKGASDDFIYSKGTETKIQNDYLYFNPADHHTRLAFSHALAQSSKLAFFENVAQLAVENTRSIPESLALTGKTKFPPRELAKMRGNLHLVSSQINLSHELLDTPEYYWENPTHEPQYSLMARYLELAPRMEVLNRKLGVIHELFDMLADEQNHRHSANLEWIIIILIAIDIVIFFLHDIFKLF